MIWKFQESEAFRKENLHGGSGGFWGRYPVPRDSAPEGSLFRMIGRLSLDPGASVGEHTHAADEEVYVILSGRGRYRDDGVEVDAAPGDTFVTWRGHSHGIVNTGDEPLEFLAVIVK